MKIKFIKKQDILYKTVGTHYSGFDVYRMTGISGGDYLGRSQCDTPRMAVNDMVNRFYRTFY